MRSTGSSTGVRHRNPHYYSEVSLHSDSSTGNRRSNPQYSEVSVKSLTSTKNVSTESDTTSLISAKNVSTTASVEREHIPVVGNDRVGYFSNKSPLQIVSSSAYSLFLVPFVWCRVVASIVVGIQIFLFVILWKDAGIRTNFDFREKNDGSDFMSGLLGACIILSLRVLPRLGLIADLFFLGLEEPPKILKKKWSFDVWLLFIAVVELAVISSCVCTGIRFVLNKGGSVTRTITIATQSLFIEQIDEHVCKVLNCYGRSLWMRPVKKYLDENYGSVATAVACSCPCCCKNKRAAETKQKQ